MKRKNKEQIKKRRRQRNSKSYRKWEGKRRINRCKNEHKEYQEKKRKVINNDNRNERLYKMKKKNHQEEMTKT